MSVDEAPKASRREWVGLAVLALPCLLYSMDLEVLYLAVPKLSADLGPTSSQLLWITDIYGFLLAGFLITMGTLGDRIGRRRLLMIGAGTFDPLPYPQHVPRPGSAHLRHRGVGYQLLSWRRARPACGRGIASVLLVGLGVPGGCAGDGASAHAGTSAVAGFSRS